VPSEFTRSPKLLKGALAVYPKQDRGTQPRVIVFQYNPEQVRRTLAARAAPPEKGNAGAAREEVLRVAGPPVETITMTVFLSLADQMEQAQSQGDVADGLMPALATLELLLYPSTDAAQAQKQQAAQGKAQVAAADLPLTLLVWGRSRVAPVLVTSFSVAEEAFDENLNVTQAKVDLALKVLTYVELKDTSLGYDAFMAYQRKKEQLAGNAKPQGSEGTIRGMLPG
jgi:hypothetical protein